MANSFTSTLVSDLVGIFKSAAIQEGWLLWGLEKDLLALNNTFKQIQGVLDDAEMKQTTQKAVEEWLRTLNSASLEVENVLDEAKTEAMIQSLDSKIRTFFSTQHNPLVVKIRIAHKVKNMRKKLEDIDANRSKFNLNPNTTSIDAAGNGGGVLNRETSSLMSKICGRDEEKKMIVDKICSPDIGITRDDDDVRVYAIWGMGGIGKTTIAQYVYNHEKVNTFEFKCWVYVSTVFDVERIIKQIIKAIRGREDLKDLKLDEMLLGDLQIQLQNKLTGKKYFIVMDDVWVENKDMKKWEDLCNALRCGAKGSTVMVTTRKKNTAQLMAKIPELVRNVKKLSKEDSWALFKMFAFPDKGERENVSSKLELVGKKIVEKCNGLPLAVKTVGSLMLTKEKEVNEWQDVNDNFKWEQDDDIVLPALRLSYNDLPPRMKICFAYCCVFSKGEEMSKDSLIELWIANGFIPSEGGMSSYVLGQKFFTFLVQRSFFQDVVENDTGTGVMCKMHDLMHDLAQYEMGDDCAVIEPGKEIINSDEVLHLSLSCKDFEFSKQDLKKLRPLRSMLVFHKFYESNIRQISNHVYLRVLYVNLIEAPTLPESICKLIHLRYLKISESEIEVLPESIIYLQNLQTLILESCSSFRELPKGLRYMRNLQRLDTGSSSLHHMPAGIKELTNLQRLSCFVVGEDDEARIGELGNLNLGWKLVLKELQNVRGLRDAKSANLKDKTNLKSLELDWPPFRSETEKNDSEVVEGLEPNSILQELTIKWYLGILSPSWLVKLVNLTSIKFYRLEKCEQLPPFEKFVNLTSVVFHGLGKCELPPLGKLPGLKTINLGYMGSLKCFHNDDRATSKDEILFPSLQELHISSCWDLVSLPNNFPKLQSLKLVMCNKLCSLPDEIQSFKDLNQITIIKCEILSRRCKKTIGQDWHKISHIPHLNIQAPRSEDEDNDENEDKRANDYIISLLV